MLIASLFIYIATLGSTSSLIPAPGRILSLVIQYVVLVHFGNNIFSWCFIALLVWCAAVWDLNLLLATKHFVEPRSRNCLIPLVSVRPSARLELRSPLPTGPGVRRKCSDSFHNLYRRLPAVLAERGSFLNNLTCEGKFPQYQESQPII